MGTIEFKATASLSFSGLLILVQDVEHGYQTALAYSSPEGQSGSSSLPTGIARWPWSNTKETAPSVGPSVVLVDLNLGCGQEMS